MQHYTVMQLLLKCIPHQRCWIINIYYIVIVSINVLCKSGQINHYPTQCVWAASSKYAAPAGLRFDVFACSHRITVPVRSLQLVSHCFPLMDPDTIPCCDTITARNDHEADDMKAGQPSRTPPYQRWKGRCSALSTAWLIMHSRHTTFIHTQLRAGKGMH